MIIWQTGTLYSQLAAYMEYTVGGSSLFIYPRGRLFTPGKGGGEMVTFSEVFALLTLIVDVITLVVLITTKKK